VDCFLIRKSYDPQNPTVQFLDRTPETVAVVLLGFHLDWILDHPNAPLLTKVGPLSQDLILEIVGESILDHPVNHTKFSPHLQVALGQAQENCKVRGLVHFSAHTYCNGLHVLAEKHGPDPFASGLCSSPGDKLASLEANGPLAELDEAGV
jgi:hypothetical protein